MMQGLATWCGHPKLQLRSTANRVSGHMTVRSDVAAHLELFGDDIEDLAGARALGGDEDAHEARVVVEGAEGGAVVHPLVLVQHPPVQPAVHALPCTMSAHPVSSALQLPGWTSTDAQVSACVRTHQVYRKADGAQSRSHLDPLSTEGTQVGADRNSVM